MLETRAAEGDGEANFTLSNLYSSGGEDGMRENFMKTLNYLMAAANAGHPLAIEMLDRMNMKVCLFLFFSFLSSIILSILFLVSFSCFPSYFCKFLF